MKKFYDIKKLEELEDECLELKCSPSLFRKILYENNNLRQLNDYYKSYIGELHVEIAQLNKIIERLETLFDTPYFDVEVSKQLGDDGFFTFKQMYKACNIVFKKRLQELKEEGK